MFLVRLGLLGSSVGRRPKATKSITGLFGPDDIPAGHKSIHAALGQLLVEMLAVTVTASLGIFSWCLRVASYSCVFVVVVP